MTETLTAEMAFKGDDAGALLYMSYGRPPTTTRIIGHNRRAGRPRAHW